MKKRLLCFLGFILLLASACNLPVRSAPGGPKPPQAAAPSPSTAPLAAPTLLPAPSARPPVTATATYPPPDYDPARYLAYPAQPGDTLNAVAAHFGVAPAEIRSDGPLLAQGLLAAGQTLLIPRLAQPWPPARFLLPDSALVNSPCGRSFELAPYVAAAGGLLSRYTQPVEAASLSGAEVVRRVAQEASVNPRVLLAFIEYRSHWLRGSPAVPNFSSPLGFQIANQEGLYLELSIAANLLNLGYYDWRAGKLSELTFLDGRTARLAPELNAGSVALQYLFARMFSAAEWEAALYGPQGFLAGYQNLFGGEAGCEPLFPAGLQPPALELPFAPGEAWALTGGLHADWIAGTPPGALDFAPITGEPPCAVSRAWVRAPAAGHVTRAENGLVQLALVDAAGRPTGWEVLFLHIARQDRVALGAALRLDDPIGHPSCEGGLAGGTHVHLARQFNGEWVGAGQPLPLVLSGWLAVPGERPYQSTLRKGEQVIESDVNGSARATVIR